MATQNYTSRVRSSKARSSSPTGFPSYRMTKRELEVFRLLLDGMSNKEVALQLGISVPTAQYHATRILKKLGVQTRRDLLVLALRHSIETRRPFWESIKPA